LGAQPFAQCPEVLASVILLISSFFFVSIRSPIHRETEPDAFYLDVLFNTQPLTPNAKEKQRAPNALVPSQIVYTGGQMDFTVDLGTEVCVYRSR
jgi:hypothetical protein